MKKLLVFTDLDGTLLDHRNYSYAPALPALRRLEALGAPVILNSSKTEAEIRDLRSELGNPHPFVVENGGAIFIPRGYFAHPVKTDNANISDYETLWFGEDYSTLCRMAQKLKSETGYRFRGFAEMTAEDVAGLTGLSLQKAQQAKERSCTEPLLWEDTAEALEHLQSRVEAQGLRLVRGGRFCHLMGTFDKATALHWLLERYRLGNPAEDWITIALGDGANDRAMLEEANISVVIRPANGNPLQLRKKDGVHYPDRPGPAGWRDAIDSILNTVDIKGA